MYFRSVVAVVSLPFLLETSFSQDLSVLDSDALLLRESEPLAAAGQTVDPPEIVEADEEGYPVDVAHDDDERRYGPARDAQWLAELAQTASSAVHGDAQVMTNEDVIALVHAEFSDATIVAVIDANDAEFDVRPGALVQLKGAGVSESLIESMISFEAARRKATAAPKAEADVATVVQDDAATAESLLLLSQAIERLAAAPAATANAEPVASAPAITAPPGPKVWLLESGGRTPLPESASQVAFAEPRGNGMSRLRTLQGLSAYRTLSFASPALAIANEIGSLFRSDDPTVTAVWALPGPAAGHRLAAGAALDVEFDAIPGIDPDSYVPAVVQLVPTADNFRLVAAARTKLSDLEAGVPTEAIVEERMAAEIVRTDRGRFRVSLDDSLYSGEYALVLRPIESKNRRRNAPRSLGELLGTGGSQLLYLTWDFAIVAPDRLDATAEFLSADTPPFD